MCEVEGTRGAKMRVFGKRVSAKPASPRRLTASIHPLAAPCGGVCGGIGERSEPTCIKTSTRPGAKEGSIKEKGLKKYVYYATIN